MYSTPITGFSGFTYLLLGGVALVVGFTKKLIGMK